MTTRAAKAVRARAGGGDGLRDVLEPLPPIAVAKA